MYDPYDKGAQNSDMKREDDNSVSMTACFLLPSGIREHLEKEKKKPKGYKGREGEREEETPEQELKHHEKLSVTNR